MSASNRLPLEQDGQPTKYDARNALARQEPAGGTATVLEYNAAGSLVKETAGSDVTYYVWNADEMLERVDLPGRAIPRPGPRPEGAGDRRRRRQYDEH